MELPVTLDNSMRLDLIGRWLNSKHFVICEVKFGNSFSSSDDPYYAADEVVKYYQQIKKNYMGLSDTHHYSSVDGYKGKEFNWEDVAKDKKTELIVVANAAYWAYWIGHRGMKIPTSGEYEGITESVTCYSIDVSKDSFDIMKKKNGGGKYIPTIETDKLEVL